MKLKWRQKCAGWYYLEVDNMIFSIGYPEVEHCGAPCDQEPWEVFWPDQGFLDDSVVSARTCAEAKRIAESLLLDGAPGE